MANRLWPAIKDRPFDESKKEEIQQLAKDTEQLVETLGSPTFYEQSASIVETSAAITSLYGDEYRTLLEDRNKTYASALDDAKGRREFSELADDMSATVLVPLQSRILEDEEVEAEISSISSGDSKGQFTLSELESDLAAASGLRTQVIHRIQELTTPKEQQDNIAKVRLSEFFSGPLDTREEIEEAIERLADHLYKLRDEGAKIILE